MLDAPSDPKGYYAALGLDPAADAAAIKSAFHARAKRVHPDRNARTGALAEFQRISEAYRVLRDPLQRLSYEAFGEAVPPAAAIKPHACDACGGVSAQPRYAVFELVKSYLFLTRRSVVTGIFCPACAKKAALRASLETWLKGWWSPAGLVLTPLVLLRNLFGGVKPAAQNFNLLLHQTRAFAARGETEVAAALAMQAQAYVAVPADAERLKVLTSGLAANGRRLRSRWGTWNYAFVLQLLPFVTLVCAASVVAGTDEAVADLVRRSLVEPLLELDEPVEPQPKLVGWMPPLRNLDGEQVAERLVY